VGFIPVSDEQVIGFFKGAGAKVRAFAAARLATRRARLVTGSACLVVLVALGIALKPRPSTIPVQGLVLEIEARDILVEETGLPHCRVLIAVGDTTETTVLLPPPVPEVGHFIPLKKKWREGYALDLETWNLRGPS
jgi:hypothetical protein